MNGRQGQLGTLIRTRTRWPAGVELTRLDHSIVGAIVASGSSSIGRLALTGLAGLAGFASSSELTPTPSDGAAERCRSG